MPGIVDHLTADGTVPDGGALGGLMGLFKGSVGRTKERLTIAFANLDAA